MAETVYNFTVADTSPTLTYGPYVAGAGTTGGWQSVCPTYVTSSSGQNSYICDPDSAHSTSSYKASVAFSFEGTGIYLVGNTTNSLGYDISLDGVSFPGNAKPDAQLLYSATGLQPGAHSISLVVRQPASSSTPGSITLKEIIVSASTGLNGAAVTRKILDDGDPSIQYDFVPGGNWTVEGTYTGSIGPEGISSSSFHESFSTDSTAKLNFRGTGVFAYGACYSHSRYAAYAASMDGGAETSFDGTVNLYSTDGIVKQRSGKCLRYFKTGLDGSKDHTMLLRVKDAGRLALDWIEVVQVSGGQTSDGGTTGSGGSNSGSTATGSRSMTGILAGAIAGGVVLVLALIALAICLRRRRNKVASSEGEKDTNLNEPAYGATPYHHSAPVTHGSQIQVQMPVNPYQTQNHNYGPGSGLTAMGVPISAMPPWPQPQGPEPGQAHMPSAGANYAMAPGRANRISLTSSNAPLVSPGMTSTYSGSTGAPSNAWTGSSYPGHLSPGIGQPVPKTGYVPSGSASGSNMAVEGGGASARFDTASSLRQDMTSPAPPAYDPYDEYGQSSVAPETNRPAEKSSAGKGH